MWIKPGLIFSALVLLGVCAPSVACAPTFASSSPLASTPTAAPKLFDGNHAYQEYLLAQMKLGPRPPGSAADRATGDYILTQLHAANVSTETQEFNYRAVPVRNVIGKLAVGKGPLIIVGAHYDTRPRATEDKVNPSEAVPGADDGASGVAVLLELARVLDPTMLHNEVWLAFFDAEDNGELDACALRLETPATVTACDTTPWPWSVGASHVAQTLQVQPAAVIILDMIGDADQNIYYEQNSDKELQQQIWGIAARLGYADQFIPKYKWSMDDDHTPFLARGIRAVDIIDFDYKYWHTTEDTADKVSATSLERVGRVMQTWLEEQ